MVTSLLQPKYLDFQYYQDANPLYLQNSYGFLDQLKIWFDLLVSPISPELFPDTDGVGFNGVDNVLKNIFNIYNFTDPDYLTYVNSLPGGLITPNVLDIVGKMFCVYRLLKVEYQLGGNTVTENLTLNNQEMLLLIKAKILSKNYDGSYTAAKKFYSDLGLKVGVSTDSALGATYDLLTDNSSHTPIVSLNVKHLFRAGLISIDLLGVEQKFVTMKYDSGGTSFEADNEV